MFTVPIGSYGDDLDDLPASELSATLVGEYVRTHWSGDVRLVPHQSPLAPWTETEVRTYLQGGLARTATADTVVIYWASHAGETPLRLNLSDGGTLHADDLADWMLGSPASQILLLLDCCYSGNGVDDLLSQFLRKKQTDRLPEGKCVSVIASASLGELSREGMFVSSMLHVLKEGPPAGLSQEHAWLDMESAVTPEQLARAITCHLQNAGATQAAQARVLLGDPGRLIPRVQRPVNRPSVGNSRLYRELTRAARESNQAWDGDASDAALAQLASNVPDLASTTAAGYLAFVIECARLAISVDSALHKLLPAVPTATLPQDLRRAFFVARRTWLDFEWPSTLDYAFAVTQGVHKRSHSAIARLLLLFAMALLRDACGDPKTPALFEWAQTNGIGEVEYANIKTESRRKLGERRMVVEFLPSSRLLQSTPPRSARGQLWIEGTFVGDPVEVVMDGSGPESAAAAIARLATCEEFERSFDSIDLVLPPSLLTLDPGLASIAHPSGQFVAIDQVLTFHRRFSERLRDPSEVQVARALYRAIIDSPENVMIVDETDTPRDLYDRARAGGFGVAFQGGEVSVAGFDDALLAAVRATPIVIWPVAKEVDIATALQAYWPEVPEAIRLGRQEPDNKAWLSGGMLMCIWEDPAWLEIAEGIGAYDEEGIA